MTERDKNTTPNRYEVMDMINIAILAHEKNKEAVFLKNTDFEIFNVKLEGKLDAVSKYISDEQARDKERKSDMKKIYFSVIGTIIASIVTLAISYLSGRK